MATPNKAVRHLELYVNPHTSQKAGRFSDDGAGALRPSHQALLRLVDTTDPAWPSVAAVLREMADAGVELGEAACEIATKVGAHRHRLAMRRDPKDSRRRSPAYLQMTLAGTGGSIVYYVRRAGFIKIGTTANPARRFTNLMPEEILAFEPGTEKLEKMRHRQFSHLRQIRKEYFQDAPELLEHIRQLRHLHGDPDPSWPSVARKYEPPRNRPLPPLISHEKVTVTEASRRLGISEHRVWAWVRGGLISPVGQEGRSRLFYADHIAAIRDRYDRHLPLSGDTCPRSLDAGLLFPILGTRRRMPRRSMCRPRGAHPPPLSQAGVMRTPIRPCTPPPRSAGPDASPGG